jgi:hypothetical protein
MIFNFFYGLLICTMFVGPLYPVLDGRETPVYLDSLYTFTNYEWVRGVVDFGPTEVRVAPNLNVIFGMVVPLRKNTQLSASIDSTTRGEVATIILEKPLYLPAIFAGGVRFKTLGGYQGIVYPGATLFMGDVRVIDGDITIDNRYNSGIIYPTPISLTWDVGPSLQPNFVFDSATTSTLRLKNIMFASTADDDKPFITGINPDVRHKLILENTTFFMSGNMTFTNVDVEIGRGVTTFAGVRGNSVTFYGKLKISDFGVLKTTAGVNIHLKPAVTSNDYFEIAPHGTLALTDSTLTFTRALRIPSVASDQNTYSKIVLDGRCVMRALNVGDEKSITIGMGPQLTYTYDGLIDIRPFSSLEVQNAQLINKNFIL